MNVFSSANLTGRALLVSTLLSACTPEPERDTVLTWATYQSSLDEIDDLASGAEPPTVYQLDWGGISVVFNPLNGAELANVATTKDEDQVFTEAWFWNGEPPASNAAFGFRWACDECSVLDPAVDLHEDWQDLPYYEMTFSYLNALPPAEVTMGLGLQSGSITRYTFVVRIGNTTTGHLLREVHTSGLVPVIIDHWAFRPSYDPPSEEQPEVLVQLAQTQYVTTSQFFEAMGGLTIDQYAKITYSEGVGSDY